MAAQAARTPAQILSPVGGAGIAYPTWPAAAVPGAGQASATGSSGGGDVQSLAVALRSFLATKYGRAALDLFLFFLLCLVLQIANFMQDYILSRNLGIIPREAGGLVGIVFCHVLHWGWKHLTANMGAFAWCGAVVYIDIGFNRKEFVVLSAFIALVTGVLTWIISRTNSCTVGTSGLIFGYMLWIVSTVFFHFEWRRLILAGATLFFWGSALLGILPSDDPRISWQGHLSGAIAGVLAAWMPIYAHRHCPGALRYLDLPVKDPREPQAPDSLFAPAAWAQAVAAFPVPSAPPLPAPAPAQERPRFSLKRLFGGKKGPDQQTAL
eukprot:tig00020930_g16016.t1